MSIRTAKLSRWINFHNFIDWKIQSYRMEPIKSESLNHITNSTPCLAKVASGLIGIKHIKTCLNVVTRFHFLHGYRYPIVNTVLFWLNVDFLDSARYMKWWRTMVKTGKKCFISAKSLKPPKYYIQHCTVLSTNLPTIISYILYRLLIKFWLEKCVLNTKLYS